MWKLTLLSICLLLAIDCRGKMITVDDDKPADFNSIQAAIDDVSTIDGDEIIVSEGTYYENINTNGKAITIRSTNPLDSNTVLNTVIDSNNSGYCITVNSGEDTNTVVKGFLITGVGGGIYCFSSSPTFTNCSINGNSGSSGGGMYCIGSNPTFTNCTFSNNYAQVYGGGMYNDSNSDPILTNCTLKDNYASERGGGMYNRQDSSPTLTNCSLSGNSVMLGGEACGGGGIYNEESHPTLINCDFQENDGAEGGGIWNNNSNPTLTNCSFTCNVGTYFGGGISSVSDSKPVLSNCIFKENASRIGGGAYSYYSSAELTKCTFIDNSAGWHAGAIYNYRSSLNLSNCMFIANKAGLQSGGIHCERSNNLAVKNCTFVENSASAGNTLACRSYLQSYPSNVEMTDCILWNGGNEIWNEDSSNIDLTYSNVAGGWEDEGNIDADPCFAEMRYWDVNGTPNDANDDFRVEGDYHLRSQAGRYDPTTQSVVYDDVTSPCIDTGNPYSPIGLEPFPNGGIINMGAYGGTAEASKSYFGKPLCETIVAGDVNGDCVVNFLDFRLMAFHWCEDNNPQEPP